VSKLNHKKYEKLDSSYEKKTEKLHRLRKKFRTKNKFPMRHFTGMVCFTGHAMP
jgi:hypothetical protein